MSKIYPPSEDSYLLLENSLQHIEPSDSVLEIGVGSGYNIRKIRENVDEVRVTGTDLNIEAVKKNQSRGLDVVYTNLANCFQPQSFDVVMFNLPYLNPNEDKETDIHELDLTYQTNLFSDFIIDARRVLKQDGVILYVLSDRTPETDVEQVLDENDLVKIDEDTKKLFFEELSVQVIKKK